MTIFVDVTPKDQTSLDAFFDKNAFNVAIPGLKHKIVTGGEIPKIRYTLDEQHYRTLARAVTLSGLAAHWANGVPAISKFLTDPSVPNKWNPRGARTARTYSF